MNIQQPLIFAWQTVFKQKFKSLMLTLAIAIGVLSVSLLTGLGEGGRLYVLAEFSMLGNQTLVIVPGKKETQGGLPPLTGESNSPIKVEHSQRLTKLVGVNSVAPLVIGNVNVAVKGQRQKNSQLGKLDILTIGTTSELFSIMGVRLKEGKLFSDKTWQHAQPSVIIGEELKQQLFANSRALGQWLQVSGRRYQIIGVVQAKGTNMGMNFNKMVFLPVHSAMTLLNADSLFRVFVKVKHVSQLSSVEQQINQLFAKAQGGVADITVISQNAVLASFEQIMLAINLAVMAIGLISLFVAGILVMNVSLISVSQRTKEIGLLRAIGASKQQIRFLFLAEATIIAVVATVIGLVISYALLTMINLQLPEISFYPPLWAVVSSVLLATSTALLFAWLPAKQAANTTIVTALTGQGKV